MSSRSAESGGYSDFKVLPEQKGVGPRAQKPGEPKQQPADSRWESYDRFFRKGPMRPAGFRGHERLSRRRSEDNTQDKP
jgi:hypothetical protein